MRWEALRELVDFIVVGCGGRRKGAGRGGLERQLRRRLLRREDKRSSCASLVGNWEGGNVLEDEIVGVAWWWGQHDDRGDKPVLE